MSIKTFQHNGGTWTRPDIPSATSLTYKCAVCNALLHSEEEFFYIPFNGEYVKRQRYIPASRYWNGYGSEVFCSAVHAFEFHELHQKVS